jgi:hypothetical protein
MGEVIEEKEHILNILKEAKKALKEKHYIRIKNLSNQVVHNSSINQDPEVMYVAVVLYSLSKLIERENYQEYQNWGSFYKSYIDHLDKMIELLKKDDLIGFNNNIQELTRLVESISGRLKDYIKEVFRRSRINKASRIYEHGISMEKTAKILGVSIWELAEYAGTTGISDVDLSVTMPIKNRIKIAEDIFKK